MNEDEPPDQVPKKHPAEDFLRATKDARASRLANMPAMISMPSIGRENHDLHNVAISAANEGASADEIKGQREAATSIPLPFGALRSKLAKMMARPRTLEEQAQEERTGLIPDKSKTRRKWIALLTIASVFLSIWLVVRFVGIQNANRRLAPVILSAELSHKNAFAWYLLGDAYSKEGRLSDSERAYKKAIKLSGGKFWLTSLGQLYEKQGRLDEALVCYEKGDSFEPAGDVYERLGRTSDAVRAYRRAIESFRKISEAKNASYLDFEPLGRVFEKLHDKASARQTYAEGLKRGTGDGFWRNELQKKLAKIDLEINQNARISRP